MPKRNRHQRDGSARNESPRSKSRRFEGRPVFNNQPNARGFDFNGSQNLWGSMPPQGGLNFQSLDGGATAAGSNRIAPMNPDSFRCLEQRFESSAPPCDDPHVGTTRRRQRLSRGMWKHFQDNQQRGDDFRRKIELWNMLEHTLRMPFGCTTHLFGSTINGFGSSSSDMDVCLFIDSSDYSNMSLKQASNCDVEILANVRRVLRRRSGNLLSPAIELVPAKIPILKFFDRARKVEIDLSVNNPTSIRNTNLLYCYSQLDWRVRALVLSVKLWAKHAGINVARLQTLSSYSLVLMVLHFLQCGVKPPLLPSLQNLYPQVFNEESYIFRLPFTCNVPAFTSNNKMSLGELLFEFFEYYNITFDFARDVGSIRTASTLTINSCHSFAKAAKNSPGQWRAYMCMEEPFDRTNACRVIINREKFDLILRAFRHAHEFLKDGDSLEQLLVAAASNHH